MSSSVREIPLTQGHVALVDAADYAWLSAYTWWYKEGYAARRDEDAPGTRLLYMHRIIMAAQPGQEVDHRNQNGLDNRRTNLRVCTPQQNKRNVGLNRRNTSGYKGVHWHKAKRKWQAKIKVDGHVRHLGYFQTPREAALAYNEAALLYFGPFARLNEVP